MGVRYSRLVDNAGDWIIVVLGLSLFAVMVVKTVRDAEDTKPAVLKTVRLRSEAAVGVWATSVGVVDPVISCDERHVFGSDDRCVLAVKSPDGVVHLQGLRCSIESDVAACRFEVTP